MPSLIGQPIRRVDGKLKVTGAATYAYEHKIPNALYAVIVTSTIAKGTVASIDTTKAEKLPGVVRVLTHENSLKLPTLLKQKSDPPGGRIIQVLQDNVVRYANQPIALVLGETFEAAFEGMQLVEVRYKTERPAVDLDIESAHSFQPEDAGGTKEPPSTHRGDFKAGYDGAPHHIQNVYRTAHEFHNPMELHASIAVWEQPDRLTLYDATQGVHTCRERMANLFALPKENVRVISPYLGGGFGSKGPVWSHQPLAALAAKQLGRPVRIELRRPQMFGPTGMRPQTKQPIQAAADAQGLITAWKHDSIHHTSSFDEYVEACALSSRVLYRSPNNETSHRLTRLDLPTPSYMRAPGEAPGTFAIEVAMDELAYEAKMDPIEFRLKNYADADQQKKVPFSSKSLRECYKAGAERFGWANRKLEPRSMQQGNQLIGWGMATSIYPTRRSASSATAQLHADGTFRVDAGTQDIGTGTYTIMTQIAASTFGVGPQSVQFRLGDTNLPKTPVSGGSQTAASTGSAVLEASRALEEKMIQIATTQSSSPLNGASAQDVAVENGALFLRSDPSRRITLSDLVAKSGQPYIEGKAESKPGDEKDHYSMYAFGAQFAEVRIDKSLGQLHVSRLVGCFGAGRILNAKTARSQLLGGMVWGIGMALQEHAVLDHRYGRFVNNNLAEYHVPVNADVLDLQAIWVDEKDEHVNPLGAKGIGEIGITGCTAAIANAIFHATGKRYRELPITLDQLMA